MVVFYLYESAARMMIFIAGRLAGRKGICSAKFPFTPNRPASLACGFPPGPVRPEARLNSQRANVALLEQATA